MTRGVLALVILIVLTAGLAIFKEAYFPNRPIIDIGVGHSKSHTIYTVHHVKADGSKFSYQKEQDCTETSQGYFCTVTITELPNE